MSLDQQPGKEKWDLQPMEVAKLKQVFAKWQTELEMMAGILYFGITMIYRE